jgi:hypothetical protein
MAGRGGISSAQKTLALATKQAIEAAGGVDRCVEVTPVNRSQIYRFCSVTDVDSISIRDANVIDQIGVDIDGQPFILRAMAREQGFALVRLPQGVPDGTGLQQRLVAMTRELGDVAEELMMATASDSPGAEAIVAEEAARMRAEALQLAEDAAGFIAACDAIIGAGGTAPSRKRGER